MFVFVEEPAESVLTADGEARDRGRLGGRVWQRAQGLAFEIPRCG